MECVACMEPTTSTVMPCGHPLCAPCATRWLQQSKHTCPTCRRPIVGVSSFEIPCCRRDEDIVTIVFDGAKDEHMGITLETAIASIGVRVRHVERDDMAYRCGLRRRHVITRINTIHVSDHETAVLIIEAARRASVPLSFHLTRRRRPHRYWYGWWRRCVEKVHGRLRTSPVGID